jgi:hypothetical protein
LLHWRSLSNVIRSPLDSRYLHIVIQIQGRPGERSKRMCLAWC